ncbi:MAG: AMP-binding protein [Marinovum sp.]|nr:AMP-binding protein [Marinovum sp.]
MLHRRATYNETYQSFKWDVPPRFNMGVAVSDRLSATRADQVAIEEIDADGHVKAVTFTSLSAQSDRLAAVLAGFVKPGARIAVLLPQRIETALGHIATYKMGGIALPLFVQFGPKALMHRLRDSGAEIVLTDPEGAARLEALHGELPDLKHILVWGETEPERDLARMIDAAPQFTPLDTDAEDPALLIYTSGTTGAPKGALHAHRVLLGHLPGVEMSHDFLPQPGDKLWTPADWAWIGGLLDVLLPGLYHGVTVVAHRFAKFDGETAFDFIDRHGIQNAFLPPTALKMMRQAEGRHVAMRSVASGGETLGAELLDWGRAAFGVTINEFYGQTECNMIVSSCGAFGPAEPGIMGWPVPGHRLAILDEIGTELAKEEGDIAVAAPDPVMFLRYWNRPDATGEKFRTAPDGTRWLITGDRGWRTQTGRIAFKGRDDDVISSAGYRIGPAEIEDCLLTHPAVAMAGVVGVPDDVRGEVVAAFVTLQGGFAPSDPLAKELSDHVRARLAAYEAPRIVRFLDAMPLTTTGKIIRRDLRALPL